MRDAMAVASWTTPPDLIITVGNSNGDYQDDTRGYGYQFVAHKHLVSIHSGYLKSLIQNESNDCGMTAAAAAAAITNISVPNVSSESFAPLLSFMYTGYLDLTSENIYSVLLATHLLHMPRALDLCRAYLVQSQPEIQQPPVVESQNNALYNTQNNRNVIKPIPSRKIHAFNQSIWSPVDLPRLMLQTRPDGPFQCVSSSKAKKTFSSDQDAKMLSSPPTAVPSTSKDIESTDSLPLSPDFSNQNLTYDEGAIHAIKPSFKKFHRRKESPKNNKRANNENLKIVEYDVACCDGPIRFHRVLNENYGMSIDEILDETSTGVDAVDKVKKDLDKVAEKEYLDNYPKTQHCNAKLKSADFNSYTQQQMMNSTLLKKSKSSSRGVIQMRKIVEKNFSDHNPVGESVRQGSKNDEDNNTERSYTCVYCKHTFKSQYCYQKHAKRHINSVQSEELNKKVVIFRKIVSNTTTTTTTTTTTKSEGKEKQSNGRREVRLLDMNVQYYPCKTCGSKFPSYYFVHKHRKMCHANEENFEDDNSIHPPLSDSSSSSSSSSSPSSPSPTSSSSTSTSSSFSSMSHSLSSSSSPAPPCLSSSSSSTLMKRSSTVEENNF